MNNVFTKTSSPFFHNIPGPPTTDYFSQNSNSLPYFKPGRTTLKAPLSSTEVGKQLSTAEIYLKEHSASTLSAVRGEHRRSQSKKMAT